MAVNQLKAGAILSYISIGLSNVIGILYTPYMLRMLGQSEYGLYALVGSIVGYLTVLDLGFGNAIVRYTAKYRVENNKKGESSLLGMFFILYLVIGIFAFLVGLILYWNIDNFFGAKMTFEEISKAKTMMMLMLVNIGLSFPLGIFSSILSAYEKFVFQRTINIIRIAITPLIMIPLLMFGYKAITLVVLTSMLNLSYLLVMCWFCLSKLKIRLTLKKFNWPLLKEISGYSMYVFLAIIIDQIYWNTGQFILGSVLGAAAVAVYSVGMSFRGYFFSFSTAIAGVLFPKVVALISQNCSDKEISDLFIRTGRLQFILLSFIMSGFILFGKSFVTLWAGENYENAYYVALIVLIPLTILYSQVLGVNILQARNQQKFRVLLYLVLSIISLLLSFFLSKIYGVVGCVLGTSAALVIGNIIILNIYYHKKIGLDMIQFWKEIIRISIPLIILVCVIKLFMYFYPIQDSILVLSGEILVFCMVAIPVIWKYSMNEYEHNLIKKPLMSLIKKIKK